MHEKLGHELTEYEPLRRSPKLILPVQVTVIFQQTSECLQIWKHIKPCCLFSNLNNQTHASKTRQNYTLRAQMYESEMEGNINRKWCLLSLCNHQAMLSITVITLVQHKVWPCKAPSSTIEAVQNTLCTTV